MRGNKDHDIRYEGILPTIDIPIPVRPQICEEVYEMVFGPYEQGMTTGQISQAEFAEMVDRLPNSTGSIGLDTHINLMTLAMQSEHPYTLMMYLTTTLYATLAMNREVQQRGGQLEEITGLDMENFLDASMTPPQANKYKW